MKVRHTITLGAVLGYPAWLTVNLIEITTDPKPQPLTIECSESSVVVIECCRSQPIVVEVTKRPVWIGGAINGKRVP